MYMYNRFPFFKIYKQFYEKNASIQLLVCSISRYTLFILLYKGIYDGQTKNTKAMSKCHTYIQKYIR